jgi:glutamine synthetase
MEYVRLVFADVNGAMKGKMVPKNEYDPSAHYGMPRSVLMQDIEGEENTTLAGYTPESGDTDMKLTPDQTTYCLAPGNSGMEQVIVDLQDPATGELAASPRSVLKRAVDRLASKGFGAKLATELEFYVLKGDGELYDARELEQPYGDMNALDKLGGLLNELVEGTASIGLKPEAVLSESGPGQMEINFRPDEPLAMADRTFLFKQMVREVTRSHQLQATFLAKPFPDHSGSGCHVHLSLWRDGQNVFQNDERLFEQFTAGVVAYSHEIYALNAPGPNSYRRVQLAHGYVPMSPTYGDDDRRVALRFVGEGENRRLEHRIAGSDVNSYLQIATIIHAGLNGIEEGLDYNHEKVTAALNRTFVDNLPQALGDLSRSAFAREKLGDALVDSFCAIKTQEWGKFQAQITQWEHSTYGTIT